jgi:uncharacterized protein (TIGR03437 family)
MDLKRQLLLTTILITTSGLLSAAPILRLSQTTVGPLGVSTGGTAQSQTIYANNIGDGSLNLTVTSSAAWLAASVGAQTGCPSGGGKCFPIQVALNTAGLANGTYTEFLTVSDSHAVDAPQTVAVTVQVGGVPNTIDLYVAPNGGTASTTIQTRSAQSATVSTQSGGNFLSVTGGGTYGFFTPFVVTGTSQPGQAAGDYAGAVTFGGSSYTPDNVTVPVALHVTSQPILQLSGDLARLSAVQGSSPVTTTLAFQNLGNGTGTISGVSATGGFLTATVVDANHISLTATPGSLAQGTYNGTLSVSSNAANPLTIPVVLTVRATSAPQAFFGGVVDNAVGVGAVAPGDIAAIYGDQFTSQAASQATKLPLPTVLAGTSVLVNGTPAPLYYVSNGQINFQIPYGTQPGQEIVSVQRDGQPGNQVTVSVAARAPKILNFQPPYNTTPIIVNQDGTIPVAAKTVLPNRAAKLGDTLTIYMIGLGSTSPAVADGVGAPAAEPLARVDTTVTVTLGGGFTTTVDVPVQYAGLTPNFVGLYQVNFTIPQNAPTGDHVPVMVAVPGASSNPVYIAISK